MATRVSAASTMLLGRRRAAAIPLRIALNAVSSRNVRSTSNLSEIFGANISKVNPAWTSNSRRRGELEASNSVERTRWEQRDYGVAAGELIGLSTGGGAASSGFFNS